MRTTLGLTAPAPTTKALGILARPPGQNQREQPLESTHDGRQITDQTIPRPDIPRTLVATPSRLFRSSTFDHDPPEALAD
jgi:hypothetical protein